MDDKNKISDLIVKLSVDADEALETLAKVTKELEKIVALHERISELKIPVPSQQTVTFNLDGKPICKEVIHSLSAELLRNCSVKI